MSIFGGLRRIVRRLARAPLFTAVTLVTLGVGIGATTAIFSVVYGVLLKPLPFVEPERLVGVWHTAPGMGFDLMNQSPATYLIYRDDGRVFTDIGMWANRSVTITGRGEPERLQALMVTDGTLPILGVQPALGRLITRTDDGPGAPKRTLLSYGFWQRRFGGAPTVIGQSITVDGEAVEIIGVLPASFKFLRVRPDLIRPLQFDRAKLFIGNFSFQALARLKPGVTIAQANTDMARLIPTLPEKFPLPPGFSRKMFDDVRLGPNTRPLSVDVIGDVGKVLWLLLGTVGFVLLIACANVANLYLVRSEGRQQELALRAALGANRGRMARELLAESLVLGLASGVVGLVLARLGIALLVQIAPEGLPRIDEITINPMVVLFTIGISLVSGVLFGLIPVFKFGEPSIAALKEGGRSSSDGPSRHRARNVLVVSEIALALVLLVVSGLMIRTFIAMRQVDPGFTRPEEVQTFRVSIPTALIKDSQQVVLAFRQIAERIRQIPGVTGVGIASSITMDGNNSNDPVFVENISDPNGSMPPLRRYKWMTPGFFETMGNRVMYGRAISWTDIDQRAPVVVVNESFTREFWKNPAEAIGKRVRQSPKNPWREIIGVVGNERDNGLDQKAPAIVYWPIAMHDFWDEKDFVARGMAFAVRSDRTSSPTLLKEIQRAVWDVNSNLPLARVQTLDEIRADSMAQTSFALGMLAIAAIVALLLGVVGIYGIIAYIAAQRTREIGIRMALGAEAGDVSRLFLRHGLMLTAIGVVVGVVAAMGLTRLMSALLFGVGPMDPMTYVAVSIVLGAIALLATYVPARRASRIDPIVALRTDV